MWQLIRTSSSWRECGAQPFEVPPPDKWERIVKTLKFVRDDVIPSVGEVETLSAYRNGELNACSNGAPKSAHREFFALDLTPVNKALDRSEMIGSVCKAHARDGQAYNVGARLLRRPPVPRRSPPASANGAPTARARPAPASPTPDQFLIFQPRLRSE